ncbi:MAG: hypothetical protein AAF849_23365 [Bacteroidota bacterium]
MKKIILLLAIGVCLSLCLSAQDKTVFGSSDIEVIGGFGAPILQFAAINGNTVAAVGGGGGVVLNNFFIGGFGTGTSSSNVLKDSERYDLDLGYGGIWLGYSFIDDRIVHPYISLQAAIGGVDIEDVGGEQEELSSETVGVLIPEVGIEVNITQWMRLIGTFGYRWISDLDNTLGVDAADFRSPSFGITFRFGYWGGYE